MIATRCRCPQLDCGPRVDGTLQQGSFDSNVHPDGVDPSVRVRAGFSSRIHLRRTMSHASPRSTGLVFELSVITKVLVVLSVLVSACVGTTLLTSDPAQAWNNGNCQFFDAVTHYQINAYPGPSGNAISDWTIGTPLTFTTGGTIELRILGGNFGNTGWDGETQHLCQNGYAVYGADSYYNYTYTDGYTATGKRQVMSHEIGHALGLDHSGPVDCARMPIMYPDTYHRFTLCGLFKPQANDIEGINVLY